jgi:hypothetical protein
VPGPAFLPIRFRLGFQQSVFDAGPTDLVTFNTLVACVVRLRRIIIRGTATAATTWPAGSGLSLVRRGALDTGGTSTQVSGGNYLDAANPAFSTLPNPLVIIRRYSVNPTLGGTLFTYNIDRVNVPAANGETMTTLVDWDFREAPIILRTLVEQIAVNANTSAPPAGLVLSYQFDWDETSDETARWAE